MKKNFIKEMKIGRVKKYKRPQMIVLSGLPGSGKTYVAKSLSRKYNFFLLSNDYVRNYLLTHPEEVDEQSKIPFMVKKINLLRMGRLLLRKKSFVLDKDVNTQKEMEKFSLLSKLFRYEFKTIKIYSPNDTSNIGRIQNRYMDYSNIDLDIVGDNAAYSTSYPDSTYYDIKARKTNEIDDSFYDFIITNNGSLEEFNDEIQNKIIDNFDSALKR